MDVQKINKKQNDYNQKIYKAMLKGDAELAEKLEKEKMDYLLSLRDSTPQAIANDEIKKEVESKLNSLGITVEELKLILS